MSKWIVRELGPNVPLHFTAFHPDYKLTDLPRTPAATLQRARRIARAEGVRYVYTGNVHDTEGGTTYCPGCRRALIVRDWHAIESYSVTPEGTCDACGTAIAGRFESFSGQFGRRRIPVRIDA
jgi:pyruvate formate lyase activating enzyme